MLVISKRKTRQWKQVLYFLVYIYLCDRKELNNRDRAASFRLGGAKEECMKENFFVKLVFV